MERTKTLHKYVGHTLHALMLALLFLWCGNASAEVTGTGTKEDPYIFADDIEGLATADGVQFAVTGYRLYAAFTPKADGILVISSVYSQFTDDTFTTVGGTQPTWDGKYPQQAKLQCTAGTTYYVGGSMPSSTVTIKYLAEDEPLKLTAYSPEEGSTFDVIKGTVNLEFNKKVSISGCLVTFGNQTLNPGVLVQNAYASVDVKKQIMAAYNNGSLHEGDDITFTFSGIKDAETNALLNGNGTFNVTYKASAKPMSLVSSVNTPSAGIPVTDFKSYYMKGDATSVVTVTFSDAIGSVGGVTLTFGNIDGTGEDDAPSQYYREEVPYTIDGNNIVIDFKGKLRRFADMLPGVDLNTIAPQFQDRFKTMNLSINGVKDVNGNLAYSDGQGALGSYGFVYNFKEIDYSVATDWTVDGISNASITSDTKNVELWLQETGGKAVFTGVKFAYKENGEDKTTVVPFSSLTVADDKSDKDVKLYTIPVPNVVMDEGTVTVSLDGVEAPDGVEHNDYSVKIACGGRTAATSEFAVNSAIWHGADGDVDMKTAAIETFTTKSKSTIVLNKEVGYVTWELTEISGETSTQLKSSYVAENLITKSAGTSTFDITWRGAAVTLKSGKEYVFTVKAWNNATEAQGPGLNNPTVGTASFNITPAGVAYVYSDVVLQSHIADPYLLMNSEETTYTLEFSGPATVKKVILNEGQGMSSECEVKAVEGSNDQTWIVTIPASALSESQILINVFAEDKEHRAINKALDYTNPTDGGDNVWLPITLEAEFNKPAFTVEPASESVVEKIDVITFSYSGAINLSYAISDKIKIMTNGGRTLLYELGFDDVKRPEGYEGTDKLCIVLDKPITEVGNYTIDVPSGFFNLGEQFEGGSSRAATIYYEIKGAVDPNELVLTADPAAGAVAEIPATIHLTGNCEVVDIADYSLRPTLVDDKNVSYGVDYLLNMDDWNIQNIVDITLNDGAITADGTYTLTIPAGLIQNFDNGNTNGELVIKYVIGTSTGIDNIVANAGGKVDVYTINGVSVLRNADAAAVKALKKGLYIINGKKVVIM